MPEALLEGENLEVDPPRRLVQSFTAQWSEDVKAEAASRVTWEIEAVGDSCRLILTHDQLREDANAELYGGWPQILSGLKTLLETGESLTPRARCAIRDRLPEPLIEPQRGAREAQPPRILTRRKAVYWLPELSGDWSSSR